MAYIRSERFVSIDKHDVDYAEHHLLLTLTHSDISHNRIYTSQQRSVYVSFHHQCHSSPYDFSLSTSTCSPTYFVAVRPVSFFSHSIDYISNKPHKIYSVISDENNSTDKMAC